MAVNARNDEQAKRAEEVMNRKGAVNIEERRDELMRRGWSGRFDAKEGKAPVTRDEAEEAHIPLAAVCVYDAQSYSGMHRRAA
jgi:hypothetical protein